MSAHTCKTMHIHVCQPHTHVNAFSLSFTGSVLIGREWPGETEKNVLCKCRAETEPAGLRLIAVWFSLPFTVGRVCIWELYEVVGVHQGCMKSPHLEILS